MAGMYPISAALVVESTQLREEILRALEALAVRIVIDMHAIPHDDWDFLDRVERFKPDVVLVEVKQLSQPLEEVVKRIRSTSARPAVFALHTTAEPGAILDALRAGASEYLYPPIEETLRSSLERLAVSRQSALDKRAGGKAIGFLSVKGGCGATTIAAHVATRLPGQITGKVLLADLDLQAGMIGFLLKTKSPYSIADAVNNLQRLDQSYWRALVSNGIPNLEIITAPLTPGAKELPSSHLKQVLAFARAQYAWTVLDLGRNLTSSTLAMLEMIDETYLVTTHEVPALHQAKQIVQVLTEAGYASSNLRLILNRMPKRSDVTIEELEKMLGLPVYASVANDYHALQEVVNEGHLLDDSTHLGREFMRITKKIAGVEDVKKKKFSLFG